MLCEWGARRNCHHFWNSDLLYYTNILNLCACHTHNNYGVLVEFSHQGWKIVRNAHTHRHLRHIRDIIIVATMVKILYTSNLLHANPVGGPQIWIVYVK